MMSWICNYFFQAAVTQTLLNATFSFQSPWALDARSLEEMTFAERHALYAQSEMNQNL
jgi:hypothetical protein